MSRNSDVSNVSRREFLAVAGGVAATGYLTIGKDSTLAQAPCPGTVTSHPVTMTPDPAKKTIKYTTPPSNDASTLCVNPQDTVTWAAKTSGRKHQSVIMFSPNTPFVDKTSGEMVYSFYGSESDEPIGGNVIVSPYASGDYKYNVLIFDQMNNKTYPDDPKIIVGGSGPAATAELSAALLELKKAKALLSRKPNTEKQAEHIESIVNELAMIRKELK
jgi:hypothetical protein